jgi:hypothetical protein
MQKIDLCNYPNGKVIRKLDAHQLEMNYETRFEVLHIRNASNKWFTGYSKRMNTRFLDKYNLKNYSDEFPHSLYILPLVINDHKRTNTFSEANAKDSQE